ncbi:MAG: hypothetical protein RLZZ170_921 [Actinomycetota bacterium]
MAFTHSDMKLNYLVVTTIASSFGLFLLGNFGSAQPVLAEPKPCVSYQIEGTLDPIDASTLRTAQTASVYVHFGDTPLKRHQVFASFIGTDDELIGEPALLVTNDLGRGTVEVPQGTVNVAFMTESPGSSDCSETTRGSDEPVVVTANVVVSPTIDGPVGQNNSVTYDEISGPVVGPKIPELSVEAAELAHTGPISRGVLAISVVIVGAGIGLGLGRGRRIVRG